MHLLLLIGCAATVLGVELCGQPLTWDDVRPFLVQFARFDVSKTGRLSSEDLEAFVTMTEKKSVEQMEKREAAAAERRRALSLTLPVAGLQGLSSSTRGAARPPQDARFRKHRPGRSSVPAWSQCHSKTTLDLTEGLVPSLQPTALFACFQISARGPPCSALPIDFHLGHF